ncbi:MAG: SDR family oxidoreductase [Actinomycetia bacterium]|nr:SDR family oxidoreductase [Actinomycetes bacterium]MCP5030377.1 SDR family oxidoreductase [Actinomycetes bacterium]
MELRLDDRSALITGGSQGLGRAMAKTFAAAGARVAIIGRNQDALNEARMEIEQAGGAGARVIALSADVSDAAALAEAHQAAVGAIGAIDVLVNNAGTSAAGAFLDISDDDWQHDFELKFFAAVRLIRLCLPAMKDQGWGRIINVLNTAAKAPPARSCPTAVTRAAGMAMSKALASEVAGNGVLVNALNTGVLVTKQWESHHQTRGANLSWEEFLVKTAGPVPIGRMGDAQEFANLALFLASDAASYITGTAINVDGGLSPVV